MAWVSLGALSDLGGRLEELQLDYPSTHWELGTQAFSEDGVSTIHAASLLSVDRAVIWVQGNPNRMYGKKNGIRLPREARDLQIFTN